jgi:ABC-type molybdate transport system permease subunit
MASARAAALVAAVMALMAGVALADEHNHRVSEQRSIAALCRSLPLVRPPVGNCS